MDREEKSKKEKINISRLRILRKSIMHDIKEWLKKHITMKTISVGAFLIVIFQIIAYYILINHYKGEDISAFGDFFGFSASFISALVVVLLITEISEQRKSRENLEEAFTKNTETLKTVQTFFEGQAEYQNEQIEFIKNQNEELIRRQIYERFAPLKENLLELNQYHDKIHNLIFHIIINNQKTKSQIDDLINLTETINNYNKNNDYNQAYSSVLGLIEYIKKFDLEYKINNTLIYKDYIGEFQHYPKGTIIYYIFISLLKNDLNKVQIPGDFLKELKTKSINFDTYYIYKYFKTTINRERIILPDNLKNALNLLNIIFDELNIIIENEN